MLAGYNIHVPMGVGSSWETLLTESVLQAV